MSFHEVIVFTTTILCVFIQLDFQTKSSSLMETHYWTMSIFFVALLAFAVTWLMNTSQVQAENSIHPKAMNQISLVSGIIAEALLFLIIHAVIGLELSWMPRNLNQCQGTIWRLTNYSGLKVTDL